MRTILEAIRRFFRFGAKHSSTSASHADFRLHTFFRELAVIYRKGNKQRSAFDSMTTANELMFLQHYAKNLYSGHGKIVDLGCWLGATSAALAEGLSGRSFSGFPGVVEAYDLFEWREWMNPIRQAIGAKIDVANGECFVSHVRKDLARYGDLVAVHKADLTSYCPPDDWQIEFLFVDAMKSWNLVSSIAANFFPRLIAGDSLVVQQDFAFHHPSMARNHLLAWHLREFFKPLHHVPQSGSMVFATGKTPSLSEIPVYTQDYFSEDDVEEAYRYCLPMVEESMRPSLMVAKLCHGLICHQRRTVNTAIEELGSHQLETAMKETILQSLRNSRSSGSAEWDEFAIRTAEKLDINPEF